MSAAWRAQAGLFRSLPLAQPSLAPIGLVLGGLLAAAAGAGLARSGYFASVGPAALVAGFFVRAAVVRPVDPAPVERTHIRLGGGPMPLLPLTPGARFIGEWLGNLAVSAGWVALALVCVLPFVAGDRALLAGAVLPTVGGWLVGCLPWEGRGLRAWAEWAPGLVLALLPAAVAGLATDEGSTFGVLAPSAAAFWLLMPAKLRHPTVRTGHEGPAAALPWLTRAARLPARPGETAEARLGRLCRPGLAASCLRMMGVGALTVAVTRLFAHGSSEPSNLVTPLFLSLSDVEALGFAAFALGTGAPTSRPMLTTALPLPVSPRAAERVAARYALAVGLSAAAVYAGTRLVLGDPVARFALPCSFLLVYPFAAAGRLQAGRPRAGIAFFVAPGLGALAFGWAVAGVVLGSGAAVILGGALAALLWLPLAVRGIRLASR